MPVRILLGGRLFGPLLAGVGIRGHARAVEIDLRELRLRAREPLPRGGGVPANRLALVLQRTGGVLIDHRQVVLRAGVAFFGGALEPFHRHRVAALGGLPESVHGAQDVLGVRIALVRGALDLGFGLGRAFDRRGFELVELRGRQRQRIGAEQSQQKRHESHSDA